MPRDIEITQRNISVPDFRPVTPSQAPAQFFSMASGIADKFVQKAKDIELKSYYAEQTQKMNDIAQQFKTDPDGMRKSFEAFKKGFYKNIDDDVKSELDYRFEVHASNYLSGAMDKRDKILDRDREVVDQQVEDSLFKQAINSSSEAIRIETVPSADTSVYGPQPDLVGPQPAETTGIEGLDSTGTNYLAETDVTPNDQQQYQPTEKEIVAGDSTAFSMADLEDYWLNARNADGTPRYTAEQIQSKREKAFTSMNANRVIDYIKTSQNKDEALENLRTGRAILNYGGEKKRIIDVVPATLINKITDDAIDTINQEERYVASIQERDEKAKKEASDNTYYALKDKAISGALTLQEVENNKAVLGPEKYIEAKTLAIRQDAVTDGRTYTNIVSNINDEIDTEKTIKEAFTSGKLSVDDYESLLDKNTRFQDGGLTDPVKAGDDYIFKSIGGLSKDVGEDMSAKIADAQLDYALEIENFQNKNNRKPNRLEAAKIAKQITFPETIGIRIKNYKTALNNNNLGSFYEQPLALKVDDIKTAKDNLVNKYAAKYKGDIQKTINDAGFRREEMQLKELEGIAAEVEDYNKNYKNQRY